jgi:hypothetical protein
MALLRRVASKTINVRATSRCLFSTKNDMETDEYMVFPRERAGLDYSLNWSLNRNGVTPGGDAYRLTKGSEASKHGKVEKVKKGGKSAPEAGEGSLSFEEFEFGLDSVKTTLESASILYVAEGDAPGTRVPVRIITDSGDVAATAMNGILERMPRSKEAKVLPVTCFVSPKGNDFEGFIVEQGDGVIYDESAVVSDVVLSGKAFSHEKLLATISSAVEEIKK